MGMNGIHKYLVHPAAVGLIVVPEEEVDLHPHGSGRCATELAARVENECATECHEVELLGQSI